MWCKNFIRFMLFIISYQSIHCSDDDADIEGFPEKEGNSSSYQMPISSPFLNILMAPMILNTNSSAFHHNNRVKRETAGSTGKFAQAAKMSNLKALRIYLTLFKNFWAASYVGGAHPLHPAVPKPLVLLFKQRIMAFFFPPIGDDAIKT